MTISRKDNKCKLRISRWSYNLQSKTKKSNYSAFSVLCWQFVALKGSFVKITNPDDHQEIQNIFHYNSLTTKTSVFNLQSLVLTILERSPTSAKVFLTMQVIKQCYHLQSKTKISNCNAFYILPRQFVARKSNFVNTKAIKKTLQLSSWQFPQPDQDLHPRPTISDPRQSPTLVDPSSAPPSTLPPTQSPTPLSRASSRRCPWPTSCRRSATSNWRKATFCPGGRCRRWPWSSSEWPWRYWGSSSWSSISTKSTRARTARWWSTVRRGTGPRRRTRRARPNSIAIIVAEVLWSSWFFVDASVGGCGR